VARGGATTEPGADLTGTRSAECLSLGSSELGLMDSFHHSPRHNDGVQAAAPGAPETLRIEA
jgi:hypothetical protein